MTATTSDNNTSSIRQGVLRRIRSLHEILTPSEKVVSDFVWSHPERVIHMTLDELARAAGVSDTTAIRFARKLGFDGFSHMRIALVADVSVPAGAIFEEIAPTDNIPIIAEKVFRFNIQLLEDTQEVLDFEALNEAVKALASSNNIYVFAAGTSRPLAEMLEHRLFRVGLRVRAVPDVYIQCMQSTLLTKGDVVLAISRSGTPKSILTAIWEARRNGATVISITCDRASAISKAADISLVTVTREIRAEAIASHSTIVTLLDAIYIALALLDKERAFANEERISNLLSSMGMTKNYSAGMESYRGGRR